MKLENMDDIWLKDCKEEIRIIERNNKIEKIIMVLSLILMLELNIIFYKGSAGEHIGLFIMTVCAYIALHSIVSALFKGFTSYFK